MKFKMAASYHDDGNWYLDFCESTNFKLIFMFCQFLQDSYLWPLTAVLHSPTLTTGLIYAGHNECVVVCTDLSGKEPHRQVGVGRLVTSCNLGGVMAQILAWYARDMDLIPTLVAIFPIFITP